MATVRKVKRKTGRKTPSTKASTNGKLELSVPKPGELTGVPDSFEEHKICIYGESGVGKTSLVAEIPDSYIMQFDVKRKGLALRQTLIPNIAQRDLQAYHKKHQTTPWEIAADLIIKAAEDKSVQMLVIDNFGQMYEHCFNDYCWRRGVTHPNDITDDWGQSWRDIKDNLRAVLNYYNNFDKGLILICHVDEKEVNLVGDLKIERVQPQCTKGPLEVIKDTTDFAFFFGFSKKHGRVFHIRNEEGSMFLKCSTQTRFLSPDGDPIETLDAGNSPAEAWENLNKAFNNEMYDVNYVPPKKTTRKKVRRK